MHRMIHEHLRYRIFCTRYDTHRIIHVMYRTILTTMDMTRDTIFYIINDLKHYDNS